MARFELLFAKAGAKRSCKFCLAKEGAIARVFPTEKLAGEFTGDDVTTETAFPGKNNVGLKEDNWVLCCPAHPNCGHFWKEFYGADHKFDDWYTDEERARLIEKHTTKK